MAGIEETKDVVKFMIDFAEAGVKAAEDKKFTLADMGPIVGSLISLPAAISGIGQIPAELSDMDEAEKDELVAFAKDEFDISDDEAEAIVEKSLEVCGEIYELILLIKG